MGVWQGLLDGLAGILEQFYSWLAPLFGNNAWGWAIILLTVTVRVALLPLAIKQTRSQRAMQSLQPEIKKIQAKYKTDRGLMKTDPEKYRDQRAKQQQAMMALYKERGINPASGCLPLLAQMPIFLALFNVLRDAERLEAGTFYFLSTLTETPSRVLGGALLLLVLMAATTYYSSKQMMGSTAAVGQQQQQQQKIMLYVMPVMLTVFAWNMPIGVLLYWVTTNLWTIGQQAVMFRSVASTAPAQEKRKDKAPAKK